MADLNRGPIGTLHDLIEEGDYPFGMSLVRMQDLESILKEAGSRSPRADAKKFLSEIGAFPVPRSTNPINDMHGNAIPSYQLYALDGREWSAQDARIAYHNGDDKTAQDS